MMRRGYVTGLLVTLHLCHGFLSSFEAPTGFFSQSARRNHYSFRKRDETLRRHDVISSSVHIRPTLLRSIQTDTLAASLGLLGSAATGALWNRKFGSGILASLATATFLVNMRYIPSSHALYDSCWTTFLPASLALLLFSFEHKPGSEMKKEVGRVGVPFVLGSIGSLLGCLVSYFLLRNLLSPLRARVAAGCLCASYIGGSVNFFAVAALLTKDKTFIGAMATAELIVMALYFAGMIMASSSRGLAHCFDGHTSTPKSDGPEMHVSQDFDEGSVQEANDNLMNVDTTSSQSLLLTLQDCLFLGALACLVVTVGNSVEHLLSPWIPGTACAVIAVMSKWICRISPRLLSPHCRQVAASMSEWCFYTVFASVGTGAQVRQALQFGPLSLVFSLVALWIHVAVIVLGSWFVRRIVDLRLIHVLVASNAAIGGPATAAAFASTQKDEGLVVAATTWGVVGYAVATTIGVTLSRLLEHI